ncbi:MAG: hypothetical protein M1822_000819 [Bathelium mastoideum]|nr:MAG: hypothetical protein M1822_000819 [Bathelium mastoideum]
MSTPPTLPSRPLRILMLHGYTQSGPLFHAKTRALEKNLRKAFPAHPSPGALPHYPGGCTLHYPTAPIKLHAPDVPGVTPAPQTTTQEHGADEEEAYGWWVRKGDGEPYTYDGLEQGLARVADVLRSEGPFDGVIGFSQGGALAGMVASLLEPGRRAGFEEAARRGGMAWPSSFVVAEGQDGAGAGTTLAAHPPLKFAVSYSGFGAGLNPLYRGFYEPLIRTPMLHFLGSLDTVVEEARSLRLVEACEVKEGRVVYHPGGHFLPSSQKQYVNALIAFIRESVGNSTTEATETNEKAEDMDLPF